jgi:hypothetical protein
MRSMLSLRMFGQPCAVQTGLNQGIPHGDGLKRGTQRTIKAKEYMILSKTPKTASLRSSLMRPRSLDHSRSSEMKSALL